MRCTACAAGGELASCSWRRPAGVLLEAFARLAIRNEQVEFGSLVLDSGSTYRRAPTFYTHSYFTVYYTIDSTLYLRDRASRSATVGGDPPDSLRPNADGAQAELRLSRSVRRPPRARFESRCPRRAHESMCCVFAPHRAPHSDHLISFRRDVRCTRAVLAARART